MRDRRRARRNTLEKSHDRRRTAGQRLEQSPMPRLHRLRANKAARGEMFHQAEKERQVAGVYALFIEREDEKPSLDMEQIIGVLDASAIPL